MKSLDKEMIMSSEKAKDNLAHLLAAYTELMKGDADYVGLPVPGSQMPLLLRTLKKEIEIAKKVAKKVITSMWDFME